MMDILKVEIEARETCNINGIGRGFPKNNGGERNFVNFHHPKAKGYTTEQLLVNNNQKVFSVKCVFCRQDHYSDECPVVTNIDSRKGIVRNNRLCFKCLGLSHFVQNCKNNGRCFVCKSQSHYSAPGIATTISCYPKNQNNLMIIKKKIKRIMLWFR